MGQSSGFSARGRWAAAAPPSLWQRVWKRLQRGDFWLYAAICLAASLFMMLVSTAWTPSFPYRARQILPRELTARVKFQYEDPDATQKARERAASRILCYYENDPQALRDIRQVVVNDIFLLSERRQQDDVLDIWKSFYAASNSPRGDDSAPQASRETLERFLKAVDQDEKLEQISSALERAFLKQDRLGLLESLGHELGDGSVHEIKVYVKGNPEDAVTTEISAVRIAEVAGVLRENLRKELRGHEPFKDDADFLADRIFERLRPKLTPTLVLDPIATERERRMVINSVEPRMKTYDVGSSLINLSSESKGVVGGGRPLSLLDLNLLRAEHAAYVQTLRWSSAVMRAGMFVFLSLTCILLIICYLWQRRRALIENPRRFAVLIGAMCMTFGAMILLARYELELRLEVIPLVLLAMTLSIAFQVGLAITTTAMICLLFTLVSGYGLPDFITLVAAAYSSALFCQSIRSRTKSVYIGLFTAGVVFLVTLAVHNVVNGNFREAAFVEACWYALGAGFAGLVMTAILPILERFFDIQTDISLLELSDPTRPLLRQLVQRAPGTYNHSINVASIAENAADAIGANGLLCRVGAYYHDIGKMRMPEYFVENQAGGENKHDELEPTMSRLVIVSHVKDGVELGRKYHLPRRIIDLIEQHHGTTLVEYFYHRANQGLDEEDQFDEGEFRYPGPKPQSKEAAVLMLADAVEGACRTLREPGPARIEHLVREITKKKFDDGQFDECDLTIQQLRTIQDSLIKSINAMYHGRVKYPEPQSTR